MFSIRVSLIYIYFLFNNFLLSNTKISIYFYSLPEFDLKENLRFEIIRKYRDYYNQFYKIHKISTPNETSFFIFNFPFDDYFSKNLESKDIQKIYDNYYYILQNFLFENINYYIDDSDNEQKTIIKDIEKIKKFKDKILCFDCLEKYNYLYKNFNIFFYKKIKILSLYFKNCKIYSTSFKKLLYLQEDTNIWNLQINQECLKEKLIGELIREKNKTFIVFLRGKNEFYKYKNKSDLYICKTNSNTFCKISIRFREGDILNIEQNFINLF